MYGKDHSEDVTVDGRIILIGIKIIESEDWDYSKF
jgi:hypothetical protein